MRGRALGSASAISESGLENGKQPNAAFQACIKAAIDVRESNLSAALETYHSDLKAALDARKEGLAAGLDSGLVWSIYYAARTDAQHDYIQARLLAWEGYRTARDACAQGVFE